MDRPHRIRLSRARGWRLPDGAVSVAYPTPWQNPFRPRDRDIEANRHAVACFRAWITAPDRADLLERGRQALRGKHLACWCPPEFPCHADVWLELANP